MNGQTVVFDPLFPWAAIWSLAGIAALALAFGFWRGLSGSWLRALAAAAVLLALTQPSLQTEERSYQNDIVLLVVDRSSSQTLPGRERQTDDAVRRVKAEVAALPNTELRITEVGDGAENAGSLVMSALARLLSEVPRARVAGAIVISDGQVHDIDLAPSLPAPLNLLQTGLSSDWDRRLVVDAAPAFGIIGEPLTLSLKVAELGAVPGALAGQTAEVSLAVDGEPPQSFAVPVNQPLQLPVTLRHGGQNVIQIGLEALEGELTTRNNTVVLQINGVRDRLSVLLISGEPHAGERTWRNLLKSDSSVDLVHFTILRPPDKQDAVPVTELSLIAFPTRELFVDKIDQFDLIIFDRYKLRGILPAAYLDNIRDYVLRGGAVLVSAGPDFATVESLYYSGVGDILPAAPTGVVVDEGYTPTVTDLGKRHPVTEGLEAFSPLAATAQSPGKGQAAAGAPPWGRWLRIVEVADPTGEVVMEGAGKRPLLILDHAGEGRIALLASDQAWLWGRGFEGGGPQLELLRRLAHWLMKEPQLEEEALSVDADGLTMRITRRTLAESANDVTITGPDGKQSTVRLTQAEPGRFTAEWVAPDIGLYRLSDGKLDRVYALGPAAPREFEDTIASDALVGPVAEATNGGATRIEQGLPDIRQVRAGRPAIGRGWIGVTPRAAYVTTDIRIAALLPAWLSLLMAAGLALAAWLREGRR
ncbi:MAG: hypothetical protein N2422_08990 [Rhodobacteraceae bacterium]|nr:hypothetical protein [Paracoccaceae bacterium]